VFSAESCESGHPFDLQEAANANIRDAVFGARLVIEITYEIIDTYSYDKHMYRK